MPTRILRDGILRSRAVNDLSDDGEIFYRRLISIVDDYGRCEADLDMLQIDLFPRKLQQWPIERVRKALLECATPEADSGDEPLLKIYRVGSKDYIEIQKFNQRVRSESKFPPPGESDTLGNSRRLAAECGGTPQDSASRARSTPPPPTSTPSPKTLPKVNKSSSDDFTFSDWAQSIWMAHPNKRDRHISEAALLKRFAEDQSARKLFVENHSAWCKCDKWREKQGSFVPKLWDFVESDEWKLKPPESPEKFDGLKYLAG